MFSYISSYMLQGFIEENLAFSPNLTLAVNESYGASFIRAAYLKLLWQP